MWSNFDMNKSDIFLILKKIKIGKRNGFLSNVCSIRA